jgi:nucleoprotein TPR
MMEELEKHAKEILESVEREWATVVEKAQRREAVLKDEAEKETKARLRVIEPVYHAQWSTMWLEREEGPSAFQAHGVSSP